MDEKTRGITQSQNWTEVSVPVYIVTQVLSEQTRKADTNQDRRALYTLAQSLVNRIRQQTPNLDEERFLTESGITQDFRRQAA
jgi:hypothetical protein